MNKHASCCVNLGGIFDAGQFESLDLSREVRYSCTVKDKRGRKKIYVFVIIEC
jgi:hypothetical protein